MLQKNGVESVTVSNGLEAIKELEQNHYDLILMDIQMPQMDGIEATTYIREVMKNDTPIIALSASSFEDEHRKCMEVGMNACIVKPIDINKLRETISALPEKIKIIS